MTLLRHLCHLVPTNSKHTTTLLRHLCHLVPTPTPVMMLNNNQIKMNSTPPNTGEAGTPPLPPDWLESDQVLDRMGPYWMCTTPMAGKVGQRVHGSPVIKSNNGIGFTALLLFYGSCMQEHTCGAQAQAHYSGCMQEHTSLNRRALLHVPSTPRYLVTTPTRQDTHLAGGLSILFHTSRYS